MKKILIIILCVVLCCSAFSGCGIKNDTNEKLNVVCTVFPQYDFVRQIAGDKVNLKMLVPLGTESHDYKLENMSVDDIRAVHDADLIIYVGGEGDTDWVSRLQETVQNNALWLPLTQMTDVLPELSTENMQHNHAHHEHTEDHVHGESFDEHVWTSPKRVKDIVLNITQKLCVLDPQNAKIYEKNCNNYIEELNTVDQELEEACKQSGCLIFADRFPFRYLCADYGLSFDAAFSGCSTVTDPSVAQINALCLSAKEHNTKVIFHLENSNEIFALGIAERVGAEALLLHSCHNVNLKEFSDGVTYISIMKNNIENISKALKGATT